MMVTPAAHPKTATQVRKVHPADAEGPDPEHPTRKVLQATKKVYWSQNLRAPDFFRELQIARDGGFSEVSNLFTWDRFLWAAVTVGGICINLSFILWPNIASLAQHEWIIDKTDGLSLFNRIVLGWMTREIRSEIYIAIIELLLLVFLVVRALIYFGVALWLLASDDMDAWHSIAHLFFDLVPELGTFSAMRLLNFVTPTIFIPKLNVEILNTVDRRGSRFGCPLFLFLAKRALAGIVGFDAFLVKFNATAQYTAPGVRPWDGFVGCLAFVNQMLGVVQVSTFVRWRLLVYIFGGQDGYVNKKEHVRQDTWHAMLARTVWKESRARRFSFVWFCAVMLSYSDYDFQTLTLNEKAIRFNLTEKAGKAQAGGEQDLATSPSWHEMVAETL